MIIQITRPEIEALINRRLKSGSYRDAEDLVMQALQSSETEAEGTDEARSQAIERLVEFGKKHSLSLGGISIRQLREEAWP